MRRNETLVGLGGLLIVVLLAVAVGLVAFDPRPGATILSAGIEQRVSRAYLLKNASDPSAAPVVEPGGSGYENGAANIVTAIVVDYRALDTFGEILVLFASAAGVTLLMQRRKGAPAREASVIVRTAIPIVTLFAVVVGLFVILHGHLTPGGGFPGGAILASAFVLQFLATDRRPRTAVFRVLESAAGLGLLAVGVAGLALRGSLFANFLPTGTLGATLSAGITGLLYALIGAKVAAEIASIGGEFIGEATREPAREPARALTGEQRC
jgi:multicomponent Na+:H+ antiporter subunit B